MATIQTICSKIKKEATIVSKTSKVSSATSTETYSRNSLSAETNQNKLRSKSSDDQLAEMDEVREENGRLKLVLSNMMQDYKTLQQHIGDLGTDHHHQQQEDGNNYLMKHNNDKDADLVVLSLGRSSSLEAKSKNHLQRVGKQEDENLMNHGLALRLDSRSYEYTSGDDHNNAGVTKNQSPKKVEEEAANDQTCPSSTKGLKTSRSEDDDQNLLQQIPAKKARVSVRAICNAPTMNDGCQWRKYGQKLAKGNPCPRAYYRCTISPSCPVRKHVQRCQDDMSILETTYEGTHNHPLPPSATAMASTTSAAVSMLKSSSSTSTSQTTLSFPSTNSTNINRHPFYIPNTTISTSQSHPTITLDLTTPSASSRYNKYSSTFLPPQQTTYSPAACLNFSAASSSSSSSFEHWRNQTISSSSSLYRGTQLPVQTDQALFYQPYNYNIPNKNTYVQAHQSQFMENIADVTKEITSNPSFQSALAAAISSIVGKRGGGINAESLESSLGTVGFGTSSYNLSRTSTVVPSVFPQAAGNLKLELPPFSLGKGPVVASSVEKGEHGK